MTDIPYRSIVLIGLRGSGKTTVGRILAEQLGGACVDSDEVIQRESGKSIAEIFEQEGEAGFRQRERDAVVRIVDHPPQVISIGGGAVLDESNAKSLASVGTIVWLIAPASELWKRIQRDASTTTSRPPLTDLDGVAELEQLAVSRSPTYERVADIVIDTSEQSPRQVARAIMDKLDRPTAS